MKFCHQLLLPVFTSCIWHICFVAGQLVCTTDVNETIYIDATDLIVNFTNIGGLAPFSEAVGPDEAPVVQYIDGWHYDVSQGRKINWYFNALWLPDPYFVSVQPSPSFSLSDLPNNSSYYTFGCLSKIKFTIRGYSDQIFFRIYTQRENDGNDFSWYRSSFLVSAATLNTTNRMFNDYTTIEVDFPDDVADIGTGNDNSLSNAASIEAGFSEKLLAISIQTSSSDTENNFTLSEFDIHYNCDNYIINNGTDDSCPDWEIRKFDLAVSQGAVLASAPNLDALERIISNESLYCDFQYRYIQVSDVNNYYVSPRTDNLWSWTEGFELTGDYAYTTDTGATFNFFTCDGSTTETPVFGIGCSEGPGVTEKVLPYNAFDIDAGTATVCQDIPDIYGTGACDTAFIFVVPNCTNFTFAPSSSPTLPPSHAPTTQPSRTPSTAPTSQPTTAPTDGPSNAPTHVPSTQPTSAPTNQPTITPSNAPTQTPSGSPTSAPSNAPTQYPTVTPTTFPTSAPSLAPTQAPSKFPTNVPSNAPTVAPTDTPSQAPSTAPTLAPTNVPTNYPTNAPTIAPSRAPSQYPTAVPTASPSQTPSIAPTGAPTNFPTYVPSSAPTSQPTTTPTGSPSTPPTRVPSTTPTFSPISNPTEAPSRARNPNSCCNAREDTDLYEDRCNNLDIDIALCVSRYWNVRCRWKFEETVDCSPVSTINLNPQECYCTSDLDPSTRRHRFCISQDNGPSCFAAACDWVCE